MKKQIFALILAVGIIAGCTSTPTNIADITGREWKLLEVFIDGEFNREVLFDRRDLAALGVSDFYTLSFDGEMMYGTGAPNRYSAPYTLGGGQSISVMLIRSTLMATFLEPERLPEHEFFGYMQNVYEWRIVNNNLELFSRTDDGRNIRLVFGP